LANPEGLSISGNHAYVTNYTDRSVTHCTVEADGTLSSCSKVDTTPDPAAYPMANGDTLYVVLYSDGSVMRCTAAADGSLSACVDAGAPPMRFPRGIALR